jgi:hypothetical protein
LIHTQRPALDRSFSGGQNRLKRQASCCIGFGNSLLRNRCQRARSHRCRRHPGRCRIVAVLNYGRAARRRSRSNMNRSEVTAPSPPLQISHVIPECCAVDSVKDGQSWGGLSGRAAFRGSVNKPVERLRSGAPPWRQGIRGVAPEKHSDRVAPLPAEMFNVTAVRRWWWVVLQMLATFSLGFRVGGWFGPSRS